MVEFSRHSRGENEDIVEIRSIRCHDRLYIAKKAFHILSDTEYTLVTRRCFDIHTASTGISYASVSSVTIFRCQIRARVRDT